MLVLDINCCAGCRTFRTPSAAPPSMVARPCRGRPIPTTPVHRCRLMVHRCRRPIRCTTGHRCRQPIRCTTGHRCRRIMVVPRFSSPTARLGSVVVSYGAAREWRPLCVTRVQSRYESIAQSAPARSLRGKPSGQRPGRGPSYPLKVMIQDVIIGEMAGRQGVDPAAERD
jgi:hypothetical protein